MRLVASLPRRAFAFAFLAILCATLADPALLFANDDKSLTQQAELLLAKSRDLSNIETTGSLPFLLNASIEYHSATQSVNGTGQIVWLAPGHYRQSYAAPHYLDMEIAQDGKLYLDRTDNAMPLLIYELRNTLSQAMTPSPYQDTDIKKVEVTPFENGTLTCISFKEGFRECLDNNADVITKDLQLPHDESMLNASYDFEDFTAVGAKRFPQRLIFHGGDGHTIDITVHNITLMNGSRTTQFDIPLHSVMEPWCAEPKIEAAQTALPFVSMERFGRPIVRIDASLYVVVAPGGRARGVTVMYSSRPISNDVLQSWMSTTRLPVHSCGDNGLEYQMEMTTQMGPQ